MAKPIPTEHYQRVVDAVLRSASGASLEQIEAQLPSPPTRRTLQRWLRDLLLQQRLRKTGQGRATRYSQPVQKRTPVGYDRAFLDNYRPNVSFYLPSATCAELLAHGQAAHANAPAGT